MEQLEFWLRIFGILGSFASGLIGVLLGWFVANRSQRKMLKSSEIRNELEKAYGPLYSIVSSSPEEMVKVDEGDERRVVVSREEKQKLDRILMSYPHMFPYKIVVLWRTKIRGLTAHRHLVVGEKIVDAFYGISLKFKEEIIKEYEQRLEEYYKTTGRWKSVKDLPKWTRA